MVQKTMKRPWSKRPWKDHGPKPTFHGPKDHGPKPTFLDFLWYWNSLDIEIAWYTSRGQLLQNSIQSGKVVYGKLNNSFCSRVGIIGNWLYLNFFVPIVNKMNPLLDRNPLIFFSNTIVQKWLFMVQKTMVQNRLFMVQKTMVLLSKEILYRKKSR